MYNINTVTIDHINRLKDGQLSQVLHTLLTSEAEKYSLEDYEQSVPFNITTGDGGSDGRLEWTGKPARTNRIKNKQSIFQNKATDLGPTACYEEILLTEEKGKPRRLKSEVEKIVNKNGSYILFTNRSLTDTNKQDRINHFRRAIKDAGKPNHANFNIEVFDANTIKDWANEYPKVVNLIQHFNDITRPLGFRDWNTLSIDLNTEETPYKTNTINEASIKEIQSSITSAKVIRIMGHSGLGKTRLILEAFRDTNAASKALNTQFVYCDNGLSQNAKDIGNYILSHRLSQFGIIVLDNCDIDTHLKLAEIIKPQGSLKLITIGFEDSRSIDDLKIKLDRENQRDLVKEIIIDKIGQTHTQSDIEYVTNLSEGYPWMAVRFCKAIKETGMAGFDEILPDEFIEKLLFGTRSSDILDYNIIRACSVFSAFGFLDDSFASVINAEYKDSLQKQMDFIRIEVCDDNVSETKFKETCNKFLNEDIIERRGTFYIVKPTVLAIHLAAKWLMATPVNKIKNIIEKLKDKNLDQKFLERLTDLDQLDKAKDIVDELWGRASFFGSAEVLKSSWGSLLFRYVVEVNPVATTRSLVEAFGNASKSELLEVTEGRRNLVWALEKLAFHKETFYQAAKVLFSFGVAENENWSNNARHQAAQLFQRFLAGTEADYNERIAVLEWALEKNDEDFTNLAVGCIARAFIPSGNHMRTGGAEKQGSGKPLIDYEPQTWDEIRHYWQTLMNMLIVIIKNNDPSTAAAKNVVTGAIRTLVMDNSAEIVVSAVKEINELSGDIWLEALSEFKKALAYEREITAETLKKVNDLIDDLTPQNLHDQFMLKVILAEVDYEDYSGNNQRKKVEEFAAYLIKNDIDWSEEIPNLLTGEQRQTLNFGRKIAEISTDPDKLLAEAVFELKIVPREQQNIQFIVGLLLGLNDSALFEQTLDEFLKESLIVHNIFNLVRIYSPTIESFNKLFKSVDDQVFDIRFFNNLIFGSPLSHLSKDEIQIFCNRIASYGKPGKWVAFSILFMYCYQNEIKWEEQKGLIRSLLISENLIIGDRQNSMDPFYWTTAASKLLKTGNDTELAKIIAMQLTEFCLDENFSYAFDHYLFEVFQTLFDYYFSIAWPFISAAILDIYLTYMHLKSMIGSKNGNNGKQGVLFAFEKNYPEIYQWCESNPKGVLRVAYMMPIEKLRNPDSNETTPDWHPFSKVFIDKFGKNEKMLSEISANMGTYGSVGSSVPYYATQKILLEKLLNHPFITVREWAKRMLEYTNKSIKVESLGDEQRFID